MANVIQATIANIKALTNATKQSDTYYSTDKGKEGIWNYFGPSTSLSINEGTVIKDASNNFWTRLVHNNAYKPEWFGAVGNGNISDPKLYHTINDDTDALTATVKAAAGNTVILTRGKTYAVTCVFIYSGVCIEGRGTLKRYIKYVQGTPVDGVYPNDELVPNQLSNSNLSVLKIDEGVKDVVIQDITIDGNRDELLKIKNNAAIPSSTFVWPNRPEFEGIYARSIKKKVPITAPDYTDYIVSRVQVKNVYIKNTFTEAIQFINCENILISGCRIENCTQPSYGIKREDNEYDFTTLGAINLQYNFVDPDIDVVQNVFRNVVVSGCFFEQTANYNGCIKIPVISGRVLEEVIVSNNICRMCDNQQVVDQNNTAIPSSKDELSIIGIECYTDDGATVNQLLITTNIIETIPIPIPDVSDPTWSGKKVHAFGISMGGASDTAEQGQGIKNAVVSNNSIRSCRRYGIEVIGNHITVIGNELFDSGYIGVNSKSVVGGLNNVKIIGNTIIANTGYSKGYVHYYAGILLQVMNYDMNDVLIEGNIIDINIIKSGAVFVSNLESDHIYIKNENFIIGGAIPSLYNLTITGNHFKNIVRNGIFLTDAVKSNNLNISNNNFEYYLDLPDPSPTTPFPYYCLAVSPQNINTFIIKGNIFNCKITAKNGSAIGFYKTRNYSNVIISNNIIKDAYRSVYVASNVTNIIVSENIVFNSANPVQLTGTNVNQLAPNNIP